MSFRMSVRLSVCPPNCLPACLKVLSVTSVAKCEKKPHILMDFTDEVFAVGYVGPSLYLDR
jgi:hypothetical protein